MEKLAIRHKTATALLATSALLLTGCSAGTHGSDRHQEVIADACTVPNLDQATDPASTEPINIDCTGVPTDVLKRYAQAHDYFPVEGLGECAITILYSEPSTESPIQAVIATNCQPIAAAATV